MASEYPAVKLRMTGSLRAMMIAALLSHLLFFTGTSLFAQQKLRFDNYSLQDGLSQSTIVCLLQDQQGFLWIGTEDGLNRFDGYSFDVFRKNPEDSLSIGGNFVWDLAEAPDGMLWIAHEGGISCYSPYTEQFRSFKVGDGTTTVKSLYLQDSTSLWIGTSGEGIYHFDPGTEKFTQYINRDKRLLPYNNILDLWGYSNGDIMVGTRGAGLFLFNTAKKFHRPPVAPQDSAIVFANDIWKIVKHESDYWLGTLKGLVQLDGALRMEKYYALPKGDQNSQRVSSLLFDKEENIWVAGYGGGLIHFNTTTEEYVPHMHNSIDPSSLANDLVFSLLLDRSENLWVGTWVGGISKLRKGYDNFQNYSNYDIGAPSNFIVSLSTISCGDTRNLVLGVYGGGTRIAKLDNLENGLSFSRYNLIPPELARPTDLLNFYAVGKSMFWIASDVGGLTGFTLQDVACGRKPTRSVQYQVEKNPYSLNNNVVKTVVEDDDGNVWAGTIGGGVNKIVAGKKYGEPGSVIHYTNREGDSTSLSNNRVYKVFKDKSNRMWVATANGLNLFTGENFQRFLEGKIITLFHTSEDVLYVGAEQGLFRLQKDGKTFVDIIALHGEVINAIQEDHAKKLWVATNKGIFHYNPITNTAIQFRSSDGLQSDEYTFNVSGNLGDGILAFGGVNGLTLFDPSRIILNKKKPPVVITSLKIANKKVPVMPGIENQSNTLTESIIRTKEITLDHNQNYLTFEFAALDFTNPEKNKYSHKLDGLDKVWVNTDADTRSATYTNLAPGTYAFHVKASNNDDTWNEEGTVLHITILPPPWKTWWAYAFYTLVVILILAFSRRNIIQRERLKTQLQVDHVELQKLKELDDFKSRFFANISHEFRTPLSLIMAPAEKMLEEADGKYANDLHTIRNNGKALLNLVNQMLDLSRIEAGNLQLQVRNVEVNGFLRVASEAFHSFGRQKQIDVKSELEPIQHHGYIDTSFLEKIINNLLSNAIKYTGAGGKVIFRATVSGSTLVIVVKDNGAGIASDQLDKIFDRFYRIHETTSVEGTGLGLALTKELVKIHKGEISVQSEKGKGSEFTVRIPIARESYTEAEIGSEAAASDTIAHVPTLTYAQNGKEEIPEIESTSLPLLLLVEDNEELRKFTRSLLTKEYRVIEAGNGVDGLSTAMEQVPDLVISDWMMPGMDGATLCSTLKTTEATSHIPVILLTAKAGIESRLEGLETGADDYLTKPFDARELRIRVANLVEQRKKLQARYAQTNQLSLYKPIQAESTEERFLKKLHEVVEAHLADAQFGVEEMAREIGMSRVQLHRKLTALTGQSSNGFLRNYRLQRANDLLQQGAGNVSEIAYQVGYENLSYFSKSFKEQFGKLPSEVSKS